RDFHVTGVQTCALPISDPHCHPFRLIGDVVHVHVADQADPLAVAVEHRCADQVLRTSDVFHGNLPRGPAGTRCSRANNVPSPRESRNSAVTWASGPRATTCAAPGG